MKTFRLILLACGVLAGTGLFAQEGATMATPPPPPPPSADDNAAPTPAPTPVDGLIHVQELPTTAQLTKDAEAEGMAITRMEQSTDRIVVTYRYASGNTRTFAYTTVLPEDPDTVVGAPPPAPASESSPHYTVIYSEPPPVYYTPRYYSPRYYDPFGPSLSIGLGFGRTYGTYGHFGHSYRPRYYGGYHGGRHYSPRWRR